MARRPNTEEIIDEIQEIRNRNNALWMDLLRLAIHHNSDAARIILKAIASNDREVTKWLGKL